MIDPEKIKKLILGSGDDRALANEYIIQFKIDVTPEGMIKSVWDNNYFRTSTGDLYFKNSNYTWYKLEIRSITTSTTTKI